MRLPTYYKSDKYNSKNRAKISLFSFDLNYNFNLKQGLKLREYKDFKYLYYQQKTNPIQTSQLKFNDIEIQRVVI